jgi:hypothetical protein
MLTSTWVNETGLGAESNEAKFVFIGIWNFFLLICYGRNSLWDKIKG